MRRTTRQALTALAQPPCCCSAWPAAAPTRATTTTTGSGTPGAEGFTPPDIPMQESIGDMEGQVNILAWPGYAEDGSTDKSVDWVTPVRGADRLPGQRQVLRDLRRGHPADEDRRLRRGLGLR